MNSTTTVAYLCEFPTLLGGERSLLEFLKHRTSAGVNPVVVAPRDGDLGDALARRKIDSVPWHSEGRCVSAELVASLRKRGVQIVHANSLMTADAAGSLGEALGVPAVAHVRDIMSLSRARRERLGRLSAMVAVSGAVADWLRREQLPEDRIATIYNAVDAAALARAARRGSIRHELGLGGEDVLIGCVGQIALRKGQDVFLDAAARVARTGPTAHFAVAGRRYSEKEESRAFEDRLIAKAAAPPLAGRVHLLGYRHDVPSLLADLDVLVVPSRQEPLSRGLLEGLALGVPSVATTVGGTPEILAGRDARSDRRAVCSVEDPKGPPVVGAGLLVPPDDPEAIARAVESLLSDRQLRERLRAAGPVRVREAFSPEVHVQAIRDLYDRILVERAAVGR